MRYLLGGLILLLTCLHQDYWNWSNATLDFGFLPRGLSYHVVVSLLAAGIWLFACTFCWPEFASTGKCPKQERES